MAHRLTMIPIEVVVRRIAMGSYLERWTGMIEGTKFHEPVIEFFLKDDQRHDPLMVYMGSGLWNFYDAKKPITSERIDCLTAKKIVPRLIIDSRVASR